MGEPLSSGAYGIRVKYDVTRGGCQRCAYKTVCASFTLGLAQVFLMPPVCTSSTTCPGPAGRVARSLLAPPRGCQHLSLLLPIMQALPVTFTRATSATVALLPARPVWLRGALG